MLINHSLDSANVLNNLSSNNYIIALANKRTNTIGYIHTYYVKYTDNLFLDLHTRINMSKFLGFHNKLK